MIVDSCAGALRRISELFGLAVSLRSAPAGEVIFRAGPDDICQRFDLSCPAAADHCLATRRALDDAVQAGDGGPVVSPCGHGMAEAAVPLVVGGRTVAVVGAGRVFIDRPGDEALRAAAQSCGCDPDAFLAAAADVPSMSRERLASVVELIAEIARTVGEKIGAVARSRESESAAAAALDEASRQAEFRDALLEALPIPVFHKDRDDRYTGCNRAFTDFTGLAEADILGRTPSEIWPQLVARNYTDADAELRRRGGSQVYESFVAAADGSLRTVVFTKRLLTGALPDSAGILGCFTDVTDARRRETELAAARDAAEEASRTKAAFLAAMSHEVRTPLNGVIGLSNILLETRLDAEQREISVLLRDSAELLLRLVNDILDYSRLEAGKVRLEESDFVLHRVCHGALSLLAPEAERKGLALCFHLAPGAPEIHHGDAGRLRQVLLNLLSNAVKFTEQGSVGLSVAPGTAADGRPVLEFRVTDTGIGIGAERQKRLFRPYEQGGPLVQAKYGGTGLGLSICRNLVELMGGAISLESREGAGCKVTVSLPLPAAPGPPASLPLTGRTVVVVEARPAQAANLGRIIVEAGGSASIHHDLTDGLAAAAAGTSAVLLDGALPPERVGAFVEALRGRRPRPVLALMVPVGAEAGPAAAAGCDALIQKPVDPVDLVRVLSSDSEQRSLPALAQSDFAARHPLRILVAEDEPSSQVLMAAWLRHLGYHPDLASDGREALAAASAKEFDLVLLDLGMPGLNGLEAAAAIRRLAAGGRPRLVAVSAHVTAATRAACEAAGFDGFLPKPYSPEELIDCLRSAAASPASAYPLAAASASA